MAFVHLHTHTEYSLLDGSNKITEYVDRVKSLGMNAAAITDHGVMYGVIDFYRACKKADINPVLGCEVYIAPGSRFDKDKGSGEDKYYHLVLLAENNVGYQNLMKIVSIGFTEGYYYKPRVDIETLEKYHEGLIALSACLAGEVARSITRGMKAEARAAAKRYLDIFGEGNFFLELQDHGISMQQTVNMELMAMSKEMGIPLVATNDIHYTYAEDEKPHDILLCLQTGKKLSDTDRMKYEGGQYYVKSEEEMASLFPYAKEAIENTQKIADRCHVEIEFGVTKLPRFDVPEGYDAWSYLNKLCSDGLAERYPDDDGTLRKRLDYELSTIQRMGYVEYFLIVWDFINYARSQGIPVGPGRGSAAGSIVSYCLHITNIDPIKYSLLFERFLNPERVSMPDIDIDFCYERRQEVIDYVVRKYGQSKVVQIVTFGTLAARGVIRDVARVMDLPYATADQIAKMIPKELDITLEKALKVNPDLKLLYDTDESIKTLIDMCMRLEGLPRHTSVHAAGVVICREDAQEYVPLSRGADGNITTQFTMTTIEELGLLKMDFLGLRTLTVIKDAIDMVESGTGEHIDMDNIDYNDPNIMELISSGKCDGIFQLESAGMKSFMKELQPRSLEDVIAGISLYRPGPMDFIPQYIEGKNSNGDIKYDCEQLRPILEPTYGCIVYQEQVMQIVRDLGGYTLGRSDLVRRAMSKKKQHVMEQERANFIYGNAEEGVPGCASKGIDEKVADKIYNSMMDFAKYAFNKSHAACYAVVAVQTAYLKLYHPREFMAALMTSVLDNSAKVSGYVMSCRAMGIQILPPDINEGYKGFSVSDGNIRYGLSAIKSVGRSVIDAIVREREENGKFSSLRDFLERMDGGEVNKRTVESMIKSGALDSFKANRHQLLIVYSGLMDEIAKDRKENFAGQMSLFDFMGDDQKEKYELQLPNVDEFSKEMLLSFEKEVTGIYLSGHPLQEYEKVWKKNISATTADFILDEADGGVKVKDNAKVCVGGIIISKQLKRTKSDKMMAFLTLEDLYGTVEVIVWPGDYEKNSRYLVEDSKVFINGRANVEEDKDAKLICEKITPFDEMPKQLWIQFKSREDYAALEEKLYADIHDYEGNDNVVIYIRDSRQKKVLPNNRNVRATQELITLLSNDFGEENVKLV